MNETDSMVALPLFLGGCALALPAGHPEAFAGLPCEGIAIADSNSVCIRLETAGGR